MPAIVTGSLAWMLPVMVMPLPMVVFICDGEGHCSVWAMSKGTKFSAAKLTEITGRTRHGFDTEGG